ncbi:hypothetical protein LSH36_152g04039 [Paralvinella palmiformis]|uniref:non-specific protein-tyrosine kinase n=1 Tax=Paralvinella palmiformis TaxID=53620 RepID=A0AAD9JUE2_9ANNE|nr:hypothetical protein LSH36_152g04039 [Paralvinella palmiformis]
MAHVKDLYEFLCEAELQHYYDSFKNDLKVTNLNQMKYVEEEDLVDMGMTKPEVRRLKKYYKKECPQGTFGKLRKILKGTDGVPVQGDRSPPVYQPSVPSTPGKHVITEDAISVLKTLGSGEFGTVQQGVWTTDDGKRVQVAVKCLAREKIESGMTDFLKEATIMHTLDHEYIVRLYGVVLGIQSLMLVTELAPLRSLLECLKDRALKTCFTVPHLVLFTYQIAQGMAYLESKRFIHRDLAARNILVFAKDKVKISDFGLSRALGVGKDYYQTNFNVNLKLPIAWCAPECINYLKFTSASDVWAFGVAIWEIFSYGFQPWAGFTGQQPGAGSCDNIGDTNSKAWEYTIKILDAIDEPNCQRLERPELCPSGHYEMMLKCWEHQPEKRPKFSELAAQLTMMKPERVQAIQDFIGTLSKDLLYYKAMDIITILDRRCDDPPVAGMWRGVTDSGRVGYFDPCKVAPYVDIRASPLHRKVKISRKESARKSARINRSKLHAGMIGRPESDLRHTGHIGYDGAMFGDVSFIGDNYDKLPVKVVTPTHRANGGSVSSLSYLDECDGSSTNFSQSELSLDSTQTDSIMTMSMCSVMTTSMGSQDGTLTDVSSMHSDFDILSKSKSDEGVIDRYEEINDTNDELDFKMPDLGFGGGLDLGPSFMDEVMKALSSTKESPSKSDALVNDKSPLIEKDSPFGSGKTSFDNVAMVTDTDSQSTTDREGSVGPASSFTSQEVADDKQTDDQPKEEKKKKHKLKLEGAVKDKFIPQRDLKQKDRIRTLSASDEKRIDDAIELANEFAQMRTSDEMTGSAATPDSTADHNGVDATRPRSAFSLRKKSPHPDKKSFTEEMATLSSSSEILTPEAQEAYNLLVVKGSVPDRISKKVRRSSNKEPSERTTFMSRTGRTINQNIREPQGLPCPVISPRILQENGDGDVDSNPLRRLRDSSHTFISKPRILSKPLGVGHSTDQTNGWGSGKKQAGGTQAELNANLSFFAKLKEQEQLHEQDGDCGEKSCNGADGEVVCVSSSKNVTLQCSHGLANANVNTNHIPLPPRQPLKSSTLNQKPRQRKYPLDMSSYSQNMDDPRLSGHYSDQDHPSSDDGSDSLGLSWGHSGSAVMYGEQDQLNITQESDDSVFSDHEQVVPRPSQLCGRNQKNLRSVSPRGLASSRHRDRCPGGVEMSDSRLSLSVKGVKVSASELGYYDTADLFWAKQINFDELAPGEEDLPDRQPSPIPGRYKTSDNVSYEDLMEFALDGPKHPREPEEQMCDEVRLMRRVLSKDVTTEDCMYALEETRWEVHSAIKLIKLKQLLSADLADKDMCKKVLMANQWSVEDAANQLLAHPPGQDSPDLVHV